MSGEYHVRTVSQPIVATIRPPGSKSLTNRALIVAALARKSCRLTGVLDSIDTQVMVQGLKTLGWQVSCDPESSVLEIAPGSKENAPCDPCLLQLENSGTSIRFLTALAATLEGRTTRLEGNDRMSERPIGPLVSALADWGVTVRCESGNDCPPVTVLGTELQGAQISVSGNVSSQYLSALLMVAPCARETVTITVEGELVSRPYIDMTIAVMSDFGVWVDEPSENRFVIEPGGYSATVYEVEPDASAASYFFAAAAVTHGTVTVDGLSRYSLQGDVEFAEVLERMGCQVDWRENGITVHGGELQGIDVDMNMISDTAQTLAVVAPFAKGPTRIRNVAHMRHKETDRVAAVVTELRKLGLTVDEHPDGMTIHPGPMIPARIATYDDHRMAMSFAILGLQQPGIVIEDPQCTAKTYPRFFEDLECLCEEAW